MTSPTTPEAFNLFLRDVVNFSGSEREQAQRSHRYLRERLAAYASTHDDFPNLIDGDFLSGSFGRKTAIKPLDDIDVFMIIDGATLAAVENGVRKADVVEGSGKLTNPLTGARYSDGTGNVSSRKVLDAFRTALRESIYPNSEVGNAGQAVNVWLDTYGLGMDMVPAFRLVPPYGGQDYYYIPRGRGHDDWLSTNPKLDAARIEEVGGAQRGTLRDVLRMLRYWNQETNRERLSGYHVEVMALRALAGYRIEQRRDAVAYVLGQLGGLIEQPCPSQTGFGPAVDADLGHADRTASAQNARHAAAAAAAAQDAENRGDHPMAIAYWRLVFGEGFPNSK